MSFLLCAAAKVPQNSPPYVIAIVMYYVTCMNNHVHSAPQEKEKEHRKERKETTQYIAK